MIAFAINKMNLEENDCFEGGGASMRALILFCDQSFFNLIFIGQHSSKFQDINWAFDLHFVL